MFIPFLLLAFSLTLYTTAQLLPILIGQDVYQPGLALCTAADIRTNSSYYTQCDYFRSDGCNITNFRCTLSATVSNVKTRPSLSHSPC